jgi:hypothetical protein
MQKKILTPVVLAVAGVALGIGALLTRHRNGTTAAGGSPVQNPRSGLGLPPAAAARHGSLPRARWRRKKIVTPIVLAVVGVALGIMAVVLYPSRTQLPAPTYSVLHLYSKLPVATITYQVYQVSPATAEMRISVLLASTPNAPAGAQGSLRVFPPIGITFHPCLTPFCQNEGSNNYVWDQALTFRLTKGPGALPDTTRLGMNAFVDIFVAAQGYGVTSDGATASAAIPKLLYTGPGTVSLVTQYNIPSANDYDWAAFPPAFADGSKAEWLEQMNSGNVIPDVDAAGTDHATQARDGDLTFGAGALVGLAGGALLAALQTALSDGLEDDSGSSDDRQSAAA